MTWQEDLLYLLTVPLTVLMGCFALLGLLKLWLLLAKSYWDWQQRKAWRDMICYGAGVTRNGRHVPYKKFYKGG